MIGSGEVFSFYPRYAGQEISLQGYGENSRIGARRIDAPLVRAVRDARIDYSSNRAGDNNIFSITFYLVTPFITRDDGIIIEGQEANSAFQFGCNTVIFHRWPPSLQRAPRYACFTGDRYILSRKDEDWPAGYYRFTVGVTNPEIKKAEAGTFKFVTKAQSLDDGDTIDREVLTAGFPVREGMEDAKLVKIASSEKDMAVRLATGRNDRPGYPGYPTPNELIFQFSLNAKPTEASVMHLRGPLGFLIADDCTNRIVTDEATVFGENYSGGWDPQYEKWLKTAKPTKCEGFQNRADITIPPGLDSAKTYVFRLGIESNPPTTPDPNLWTIEFNGESSLPFAGFTLQTATKTSLVPVSQARRNSDPSQVFANPLEFGFQFNQPVPARPLSGDKYGGMIRIRAPQGFDFATSAVKDRRARTLTEEVEVGIIEANVVDEKEKARRRRLNVRSCDVDLRTKPATSNEQAPGPVVRWVQGDDIVCEITGSPDDGVYLSAMIKSTTKVRTGLYHRGSFLSHLN